MIIWFIHVQKVSLSNGPAEYVNSKVASVNHGPFVQHSSLEIWRYRQWRFHLKQLQKIGLQDKLSSTKYSLFFLRHELPIRLLLCSLFPLSPGPLVNALSTFDPTTTHLSNDDPIPKTIRHIIQRLARICSPAPPPSLG